MQDSPIIGRSGGTACTAVLQCSKQRHQPCFRMRRLPLYPCPQFTFRLVPGQVPLKTKVLITQVSIGWFRILLFTVPARVLVKPGGTLMGCPPLMQGPIEGVHVTVHRR